MRRRYLTGLSAAICHRPWLFVTGGVLLAVAAGLYTAFFLEFKTSRNDLIGRDSEYWRNFSEYAREFRSEEDYIVVVESDQPAKNRAAVDALAQALLAPKNNPYPKDSADAQQFTAAELFYRVDYDALKRWFLYYLSIDDLKQIRDSVKDFKQLVAILQHRPKLDTFFDSMNQMLGQMENAPDPQRRQMESFLPTITAIVNQMGEFKVQQTEGELLTPWASAFFSAEMLGEAEQQMKWQGYQTFRDGKMFVLLIHPRGKDDNSAAPHDATIPKLHRIIGEERRAFPDVKMNLTGEPVLDYDEMLWSQGDATKATVLTLAFICGLFAVSFREVLRPVLAVACMVVVLAVSMGYATVTIGHLNIITVTFAVMILGLGIDLGIQFIARYEEELSKGAERSQAVGTAIERTGTSIITAGVTNAAAFFAMGLSGFKGVIELGVIAGGGMLIATAATMLVLPALLLLVHREKESTRIPARAVATRVERVLLRRPHLLLTICGVATIGALLVGWRVRFDYNVLNLQSHGIESVETEKRLLNADAESTIYASIVCDTFDQARVLQHSLTGLATVATVHSIAELIPEDQEPKAEIIRAIQNELGAVRFEVPPYDPTDAELVMRSLASLRLHASRLGRDGKISPAVLAPLTNALTQTRSKLQAVDPDELNRRLATYEKRFYADLESQLKLMTDQVVDRRMTIEDVPVNIREMLVGKTGKFLVRVFPKDNIWDREPLEKFVREVQSVAPKVTGTPLGLYEFVDVLKRGYRDAALWALLVIAILIFIDLRGAYATLLTILPLGVGTAWMLGTMAVFGIPFNPANIMVLPLIVGIGVAYGIYVVQRYREDGEAAFYSKSTGRAVVLSGLTTIVAFASLLIGRHEGIRSLGLVMTIGVTGCLIAALALLPALLEIARLKRWKV